MQLFRHENFYDVIVIGGGASGMMAAGRSAEHHKHVLLLEKNKNLGEKLKITGGGRCNITNAEENKHIFISHYGNAGPALHSSFSQFGVADTFSFFENRGLPLKIEVGKRAFPQTEKAFDVFRTLENYIKKGNVEVCTNAKVTKIIGHNGHIEKIIVNDTAVNSTNTIPSNRTGKVHLTQTQEFSATSFILATGGKSHPETGSTGDGFGWLKNLGHTIKEPTPTIVPLTIKENWIKQLSGTSLELMKITFLTNNQKSFSLKGKILFTHFGISGPLILNAAKKVSDLMHEGQVTAIIDTYPQIDEGTLDKKITQIFNANKNKMLKNIFKEIAPPGTAEIFLTLLKNIDPEIKVHSVTKPARKEISKFLKAIPLTITGLMGYKKAVVADGGVTLKEIDTKTMRSKLYDNLFITGDLLDINRPSGGYSLQLCWTTGYIAGTYA